MSCWSNLDSSEELGLVENLPCQDENLEGEVACNVDQEGQHRKMNDGRDVDPDRLVNAGEPEDSENPSGVSLSFQRLASRGFEEMDAFGRKTNRDKRGWLRRLRSMTCMIDRQGEGDNGRQEGNYAFSGCRLQRVKVRQCRKQMKELSALHMRQDIQAHEGSITTMKFSPDGQYLASGGQDGVVRLWQVVEEDRSNEIDTSEIDPSCIYFTVNNLSELTPMFMDKEKINKLKSLRKTSDSACIIFPPKIFRLLEKPLHEFRGHRGEVLDLSWSKNNVSECYKFQLFSEKKKKKSIHLRVDEISGKLIWFFIVFWMQYLLSSSVDTTVRLWHVESEHCLKAFPHSNYGAPCCIFVLIFSILEPLL